MGGGVSKSFKSLEPKKSLGQNFLVDPWWIQRVAAALEVAPGDRVLEIGPGKGALTKALLPLAGEVVAVEIDARMVEHLRAELGPAPNLRIVHADFLRLRLDRELGGSPVRIVGNLPYHVTSAILMRVLDEIRRGRDGAEAAQVADFAVMIQKEVARRILAGPGSRIYGILSVFCALHCRGELLLEVPPAAFFPRPKVTSAVIRLRPLPRPAAAVADWELFRRVVRAAFNQRRKMLRRSLAGVPGLPDPEGLKDAAELLSRRPETLTVGEFADLTERLAALAADEEGCAA